MTTIINDTSAETKVAEPTEVPAEIVTATAVETKTDSQSTTPKTETTNSTDTEFNRKNVEALGNRVRITDHDEDTNLDLFCYVKCGPDDPEMLSRCRGVVFNGDDIVMRAFPYTVEFNNQQDDLIQDSIGPVFEECKFYDAHEGALIRMFNFGGKWYTSTHRKLNAFRSKWASKESFGTSFKKALEEEYKNNDKVLGGRPMTGENILSEFQKTLNPSHQYMFLVRNSSENRIVCSPPENPTVYHVGTFVDGVLDLDNYINIPHPRKHSFKDIDDMYEYLNKVSYRDIQGVIVFAPDNKQYKIIPTKYQELFQVRGNEPSIKFRYLQVRMNRKMCNNLYGLYPKMADTFDDYENILYCVAKNIYHAYVQRFIKKRYVTMPREEFVVIRECHSWHEQNRADNRISLNKVIEILNKQTPTNLNRMQRRFRLEEIKKEEAEKQERKSTSDRVIPLLLTKKRSEEAGEVVEAAEVVVNEE